MNLERPNTSIKTTEHQALREEVEHFQKELKGLIFTFENFKAETDYEIKALNEKFDTGL